MGPIELRLYCTVAGCVHCLQVTEALLLPPQPTRSICSISQSLHIDPKRCRQLPQRPRDSSSTSSLSLGVQLGRFNGSGTGWMVKNCAANSRRSFISIRFGRRPRSHRGCSQSASNSRQSSASVSSSISFANASCVPGVIIPAAFSLNGLGQLLADGRQPLPISAARHGTCVGL